MTFYLPVLGAVALATGTILERLVLMRRRVSVTLYQTSVFFAIVLSLLPLLYFFWRLDSQALLPVNVFIFALVILFSMFANLLTFYAVKGEILNNIEPARVLESLFVIFLAIIFSFFFGEELYERNARVVVPALIAGFALILSHIRRNELVFNKYFAAAIFGSFFFATELIITRLILDFYTPISFYFFRSSAIFLISFLIFRPNFSRLTKKLRWEILITGAVWMAFRVLVYYGYLQVGIVFTTLLIMLGPVFVYIFAHVFLKEKMSWKNFAAAVIIVGAILYASFV